MAESLTLNSVVSIPHPTASGAAKKQEVSPRVRATDGWSSMTQETGHSLVPVACHICERTFSYFLWYGDSGRSWRLEEGLECPGLRESCGIPCLDPVMLWLDLEFTARAFQSLELHM